MLRRLLRDRTGALRRLGSIGVFCLCLGAVAAWPQTPHSITISWTYTQGTDLATGFNVLRSTTSGGPYTQISPALPLSITTLSYQDSTGVAGTKYFYVVMAVDANGSQSANSTEVSAVFLGNPLAPQGVTATAK